MTGPLGALERSLREGPPDERGYRARSFDLATGTPVADPTGGVPLARVVAAPTMRRTQVASRRPFLAAVIVVAIALVAVGISGSDRSVIEGPGGSASPSHASASPTAPSPSPPSSPSPTTLSVVVPALSQSFVSKRNGFSVQYPADWTATPATSPWPADVFLPEGNPAIDLLVRPGAARLQVASQRLKAGQTQDDWLAAYFRPYQGAQPCAGDRSTWPRLPIDGVSGYLDASACAKPLDSSIADRDVEFGALVFAGGRVYDIRLDGDVDLAYFEAVLATVRLDPSKALDQ